MSKQSDLESIKKDKIDWWSFYTPQKAREILDDLDNWFNWFKNVNGWELSPEAKKIVIAKLSEIARKDK